MKRIKELRQEKHLNQIGLSLLLNVSQKMISSYECGVHQPSIETLIQMSKIFNVSVDYIIGNTDIKTPIDAFSEERLDKYDIELLDIFKNLSVDKKKKAIGILFALNNLD